MQHSRHELRVILHLQRCSQSCSSGRFLCTDLLNEQPMEPQEEPGPFLLLGLRSRTVLVPKS